MPRKTTPPPYPKRAHQSGQARVKLFGEDHYLGIWGSPESYAAYERLLEKWRAGTAARSQGGTPLLLPDKPATIAELLAHFWVHVEEEYVDADGAPSHQQDNWRYNLYALDVLYGAMRISDFGPKALKALRKALVRGWHDPRKSKDRAGISRGQANTRVAKVKALFRWAASEELIPGEWWHRLQAVKSLREGQLQARETDDVPPVPEADLERTIPYLPEYVRGMVQVQLLTGMRPGELLALRVRHLLRTDSVDLGKGVVLTTAGLWVALPKRHKTAWRGRRRVILFGPQAQQVLAPYLAGKPPEAYVFSAADAVTLFRTEQRKKRKTRVQPSQVCRKKPNPKRKPGSRYSVRSYRRAVHRACARAGVPSWSPNQLRHNAGTRLGAQFGLEITRIILGHGRVETTQIYALPDLKKAVEAVKEVG